MSDVLFFRSNGNSGGNTSIIIPSMYEKRWEDNFEEVTLLFDINKIYEAKGYPNVMTTEFIIKNNNKSGQLNLLVKDNDISIMDVSLEAEEVQKYELGISSHIRAYVKGSFTASLYIGTY